MVRTSSELKGWHECKHDPWPYINFVLYTLETAYKEFEERLGQIKGPRGSKKELVEAAIQEISSPFMLSDVERSYPGVSRDIIRKALRDLQNLGHVECLGRGPGAPWKRKGITFKRVERRVITFFLVQ